MFRRRLRLPEIGFPMDWKQSPSGNSITSMTATVTLENIVALPAAGGRLFNSQPRYRLEWMPIKSHVRGSAEMRVRVIPNKKALGRGLMGQRKKFAPRRDSVRELVTERARRA